MVSFRLCFAIVLEWALLSGALATRFAAPSDKRTSFVAVALVVASHWFLDLIVHRPDLSVLPGTREFGLGLWDHPIAAFWTEGALIFAATAFLLRRLPAASRTSYA